MRRISHSKVFPRSVKKVLGIYLIFIIAVIMVASVLVSNYSFYKKLKKNALTSFLYTIEQSANDIQRFISSVEKVAMSLAGTEEVTHALSSRIIKYDTRSLNNLLYYTQNTLLPSDSKIVLLGINEKMYCLTESDVELLDSHLNEMVYQQILNSSTPIWLSVQDIENSENANPTIYMGTCVRDIYTYRKIGILLISMPINALADNISLSMGEYGKVYLFDALGYSLNDPNHIDQNYTIYQTIGSLEKHENGRAYSTIVGKETYIYEKLIPGFSIVGVLPNDKIYVEQAHTLIFVLIVTLLFVLIVVGVVLNVANSIMQPLDNLTEGMIKVENGDFSPLIFRDSGYKEMQELIYGYNHMICHISRLMQNIKEDQKKLEREKFRVLQFQINPHFLYNTLDSIIWLCRTDKKDDTILMTSSLINFFRIALNDGQDFLTIKKEIDHVSSYLTIQQIRFKGQFSFNCTVEPNISSFYTNKLILQPIVENALYHGIQPLKQKGHISIIVYRVEKTILFEISDTGIGIPQEKLTYLKKRFTENDSKDKFGIGLYNVHQRIRLLYGADFGLSIESQEHMGTTVRISIPVLKEIENVKSIDSGR